MLVAASNPCPCGYYGEGDKCTCTPSQRISYLSKLSGPILDRIDIHLCEELNRLYPDDRFFFIFGEDCLNALEYWKEPERILAGCEIIAATRGASSDPEKMKEKASVLCEKLGGIIHVMDFPAIDISSTMIRERISKGLSVKYLVP